ncbi:hypothetical protein BDM02DRAFT_3108222 [Thelephora ganbajun]|uniref:Uncharacterized protein n=1 Tax=Thelephora ganbajun TaxID=370292 RepID=A0ACB6ZTV7_THEGA|nr:hypothetical protein BDM02DRAFT_3108222 [Thelephora ganbajun]
MLLTSRLARSPLIRLERFAPTYDLNSLPPDTASPVPPAPTPTPTQATSPYDLHRPINPSPLRFVTNVPEQPPPEPLRPPTIADLGTPEGERADGFHRTRQQNLSVPKKVRFKGAEIIILPLPTLPTSPTIPTENIPAEARGPLDPSDVLNRANLVLSSIVSDEDTSLTSSENTHIFPTPYHEISAVGEFPDSPSVYSPTPPNSSTPPTTGLLESSNGSPKLVDVDLEDIDIGYHHPSVEQFSAREPSDEQPCGRERSTLIPSGVSHDAIAEHTPNRYHADSADALPWWGRVTVAAGSAVLSLARVWEKKAHATTAKSV